MYSPVRRDWDFLGVGRFSKTKNYCKEIKKHEAYLEFPERLGDDILWNLPKKMLVPNHYTAYLWCVYVNKHVLNILEVLADIRVLRLVKWYNRQANDNGFLFHEIGVPKIKLHNTC